MHCWYGRLDRCCWSRSLAHCDDSLDAVGFIGLCIAVGR
jgi:hypothetical protein